MQPLPPRAAAGRRRRVPAGVRRAASGGAADPVAPSRHPLPVADLARRGQLRQGALLGRVRLGPRRGRDPREQRLLPDDRARPEEAGHRRGRSAGEARARHRGRRHPHRRVLRRSGLRHPPRRARRHPLHAGAGAHDAARRRQPAVADGRCARRRRRGRPRSIARRCQAAVDLAFADPDGLTAAMVVVHKGQIVGERYMAGITKDTQLESWSMGKSLTATLVGLVVKDGAFALDDPAPVPDWRRPGDPRGPIRVRDVMQMSSGLSFTGQDDRWMDPTWQYHDHFFIYAGAVDAFRYATTSPVEFAPGTVGRYRNSDPMTLGFLVRQAVEKKGEAVPDLAAARAVRSHRHPAAGARTRSLGQLPAERLRLRHGAQLGAARAALPAGRHVERPAAAARGLGHLRRARRRRRGSARSTAASSG